MLRQSEPSSSESLDSDPWRVSLLAGLSTSSATTRQVCAWVVAEWAQRHAVLGTVTGARAALGAETGAETGAKTGEGTSMDDSMRPVHSTGFTALGAVLLSLASDAAVVAATSREMRHPLAQMQAHATALLRAFEAAGAPSDALRASSFQSASWPGGAGAPLG